MSKIEEIQARRAAITAPPWGIHGAILSDRMVIHGPKSQGILETVGHVGQNEIADAEFAANAPSDIDFLLAEVERLEAKQHELEANAFSAWQREMTAVGERNELRNMLAELSKTNS